MNYVYLLRCNDGSLYCGWTTDLDARLKAHSSGRGAKYTRSRLPVKLVYHEVYADLHDALSREWHIKRMSKAEKESLVQEASMDYSAEEHFVRSFIRKDRQDRLLHELTTPKKRNDGVSRFCHQAEDFLDPTKIVMQGEDLERQPKFERFVQQHNELCFVLSLDFWLDEQFLPLADAVRKAFTSLDARKAFTSLDATLILGSTFAIVYGEPMKGGRGKYLLLEAQAPRKGSNSVR